MLEQSEHLGELYLREKMCEFAIRSNLTPNAFQNEHTAEGLSNPHFHPLFLHNSHRPAGPMLEQMDDVDDLFMSIPTLFFSF